jgi:oligo-1,6-glucosidase
LNFKLETLKSTWWKEAVVYQIYPRSFKDSNGDGVGDLRGIIEKLDYIKSLGVDAVWLNPIYKSPNADGGYDISDYNDIQPEFGTLHDFDELLKGLHQRGIKLIMDIVVNHSSDEHYWFTESRKSKDNSYRDYYIWKPGKNNGPPTNWPSFFGGNAWSLDETTGEYYLHLFSKKQPDLNWENPKLRQAVYDMMRFWLNKGVDGLRMDVISCISKNINFPDTDTDDFNETIRKYYANGLRLNEFLQEMNEEVLSQFDCVTVGEGPGITNKNALTYLEDQKGLNMIFHFGHMFIDQGAGGRFDPIAWSIDDFKAIFKIWDDTFSEKGWGSVFLGNHDFPRMVSRWGNDKKYRAESAKLLCTLLMSMRGTPFIYAGDEIGMTNVALSSIEDSKDIETLNGWSEAKKKGISASDFLKIANQQGRDNARTPFQWNCLKEAGFTFGKPWMPLNLNFKQINKDIQDNDPDSVLNYYRNMIRIRKMHPVLIYGLYQPIETERDKLFLYSRENEEEKILVALNFSEETVNLQSRFTSKIQEKLIGNYSPLTHEWIILRPWEASVYTLYK